MIRLKPLLLTLTVLLVVTLLIPTVLVIPFTEKQNESTEVATTEEAILPNEPALEVAVYRSKSQTIENLPLEKYVMGVVASEMPAAFEEEALKAQALTARTYIVKQLMNKEGLNTPKGAMVTDTVMHQVYKSPEELQALWGADYKWKMTKISEAVDDTRGKIITYNGEPITASFFSTSNGYTENSEDYWSNAFPYLRSVESPWDKSSPKYLAKKEISIRELEQELGVQINGQQVGTILEKTEGNRVGKVKIGDKTFDGREIRETLGLNSSDFTLERKGNSVVFTTKGWGHGVGMSQYGAHGMASQGKNFTEIISHYYKGTEISTVDPFLNRLMAKANSNEQEGQ